MKYLKRHPAAVHRANARAALKGNWANAVFISLLVNLTGDVSPDFRINFQSSEPLQVFPPEKMVDIFHRILGIAMPLLVIFSVVMFVIGLLITGTLELGAARYNLNLIDRKESDIPDLFSCFHRFADALVMHLLQRLLVFLGLLLFFVPGVMLIYGCAMAPYILAEDPDCTGREALKRSWDMMRGRKLELFRLELPFILWNLLAVFTQDFVNLFLNPYKAAAKASFYRDLSRKQGI